ncbi:USP8 [Cordylochernes scorpioides]|uniref:ubiquitinyl hydrolase 1 n=1 Tax=Cordylochernes scorpioides TaxID=51811 RepID=A0ABY6LGW3_9ARAC|nr:USP8 [Cordylochernes scorpioides]
MDKVIVAKACASFRTRLETVNDNIDPEAPPCTPRYSPKRGGKKLCFCLDKRNPVTMRLTKAELEARNAGEIDAEKLETSSISGGLILQTFGRLLKDLWCEEKAFRPLAFHQQVGNLKPRFGDFTQQDSSEYLEYLLQQIHQDFKRSDEKIENEEEIDEAQIMSFQLPIPADNNDITLMDCHTEIFKPDILNDYTCSNCQQKGSLKFIGISKWPNVMILQIMRFSYDMTKDDNMVEFPIDLNLSQLGYNIEYDLFGVVNHYGTLTTGHYQAYCKHPISDLPKNDHRARAGYLPPSWTRLRQIPAAAVMYNTGTHSVTDRTLPKLNELTCALNQHNSFRKLNISPFDFLTYTRDFSPRTRYTSNYIDKIEPVPRGRGLTPQNYKQPDLSDVPRHGLGEEEITTGSSIYNVDVPEMP